MKKNNKNIPSILPEGYLKERFQIINEKGLPHGYETGISNLDSVFRLDKGRLITITGVPNCGKSEFVDFYVTTLNKLHGLKTLYFSPENQPYELHLSKLVSKYANKSIDSITVEEKEGIVDYICKNFFFINYEKVKTLESILSTTEELLSNKPFDIVVIDAYNKIETQKLTNEIETEFISKILDELCEFAIRNNLMVILVAHPKKMDWKSHDKVAQCPTAYDINGSANFFNKSDFVLVVHRDRREENEEVQIRVDKVKFKCYGTQGKCYLKYDTDSGNYYNAPSRYSHETTVYEPVEFTVPQLSPKKEPLDVIVSYYSGKKDNVGRKVCLKDIILTDKYKTMVEQVRSGKTVEDRRDIKKQLSDNIPAITISGTFSQRQTKYLEEYSRLIAIDIDNKENQEIMPRVKEILSQLDYVAYCGRSISGDGYFAIIPIENPLHFKQHFYALEEEMATYGIVIDKSCKDITRLRYVSYDENHYYNPNANTYYWEKEENKSKPQSTATKIKSKKEYTRTSTMNDKEIVENELEFLRTQSISLPDDYQTWFTMGMSLNSAFGEEGRTYFHKFSSLSDKYNEEDCNKQYDSIISNYGTTSDVKLGTLFHIINQAKEDYNNNLKS